MFKSYFIVLLLIFAACNQPHSETSQHIVRINIGIEPQTLDPRKARTLNDLCITKMFFDGLMRLNAQEQPELAAAENYTVSDDGLYYIFTLRPHQWSNGDPVTADDFIRAWKTSLAPDFPSDNAFQLFAIKNAKDIKSGKLPINALGLKALDSKTLSIELEQPIPYFLSLLAQPIFFPLHSSEDYFISNGAFLITKWMHQDYIKAEKNKFYWDAHSVRLDGLKLLMVQDDTALKMFEEGQLDWEGSPYATLPVEAIPTLRAQNKLESAPFLGTCWLRVNTAKAPFHDVNHRRAFASAIDRQALVTHVTQGDQIPSTTIVPSILNLQKTDLFTDADIAKARTLFQKSNESISLLYPALERGHKIAQALQDQWRAAFDMTIHLEPVEAKVFFDRISKQDYQLSIGSWIADFADPINFLEVFQSKTVGTNNTGWEHPTYKEILEKSNAMLDPQKRLHLLSKAERLLIDEMPIIPLFTYSMLYVKNKKLKNVTLSPTGSIDLRYAFLEE